MGTGWGWIGKSALALALLCGVGEAQVEKPTGLPETPRVVQAPTDRKVPSLARAISLADFDGMKPRAEVEAQMTKIDGFIQSSPSDGRPATQRTEAWIGHTSSALYVVFLCFDDHPELLRGHLARRENILSDDTVSVLLDPFQDRRRGVIFQLNAVGVQADGAWTDSSGADYSYDQVWDSEGRTTAHGWMALFAIPFRSLRFRAGTTAADWGVVLLRNLPRNSEVDAWPRVATNISGTLTQEGTLHGIEGVTGSHNIQINPYVLAQNEKTLEALDPLNPYFSSRRLEGTAGGEAKIILKDSVVIDATVNPDFSDVESEQPQFTVNQRYPVYFPELRPFFLENANYFSTPINLVYTRNIVHPEFGVRVTGKVGNTNIGLLTIDDRLPGDTVPQGDPLRGKDALFAVGRVAQDFGKNLTVGALFTDEEFGGGWNRIGGLDFTARLGNKWTVTGQMAESSTMPNRADSAAAIFTSHYSAGPASDVQIRRNGHAFNLSNDYSDFSTGFASEVGFIQTADIRTDGLHATYMWFPKSKILQDWGLETNQNVAFDHQGNRVYHYSTWDPFIQLPRKFTFAPLIGENSDTLGPQDGTLFPQNHNFTENFGGIVLRGAPLGQFNFNLVALRSGNVNYNPVAGGLPFLLNQQNVTFVATVQPLRQLTIDNTYLLDRDFAAHGGQFVYESQTMRTKINYQFTRALSARVIVQYNSTLTNPSATSLSRTKQVAPQALLTWLPHPGTAIYIGYNGDLQNLDRAFCQRTGNGECNPNAPILPRGPGYLNDGKQFFVKASYLLRF